MKQLKITDMSGYSRYCSWGDPHRQMFRNQCRAYIVVAVTADVENTAKSLQLSYTMGGMSVKVAETSVDNGNYVTGGTKDLDGTTVALSLAF